MGLRLGTLTGVLALALAQALAAAGRGPKVPTLTYHHVRELQPGDSPSLRNISCPPGLFAACRTAFWRS